MNFFSIIIAGYFILATYIIYLIIRDTRRGHAHFFGRHKIFSFSIVTILGLGFFLAFDARFIEPWTIRVVPTDVKISNKNLTTPIKIAFIADVQVGNHKKSAWVEKIVERIEQEKPDVIILGGDQIDNEGTIENESLYLEPLRTLATKYPIYAIMGNHEYGIGNATRGVVTEQTGDRSLEFIAEMNKIGIKILRNELICPQINNQKICFFGIDDIWKQTPNFDNLKSWDQATPLIFITHNPDGVLSWPTSTPSPNLVLAGHTHGGQVYLPFVGPLGSAGIELPPKYYRGLNQIVIPNTSEESPISSTPIFTTVGIGESGGAVRFWTLPEIVIVNLKPQK